MIEASTLRDLIFVDEKTGALSWKERPAVFFKDSGGRYTPERAAKIWNSRYSGTPALSAKHRMGYLTGKLFYVDFLAHRVVWALVNGEWPRGTIDHINGIKTDNRPENLRDVPHFENMRNQRLRSNNSTGEVGVFRRMNPTRYDAFINTNGKKTHVGTFLTIDEAVMARKTAGKENMFHENHGRKM